MSVEELRAWLALLDAGEFARRHDLPELARFMLATGLRLGEALGVTCADVDLDSRVSMTQNVYLGRRAGNAGNLQALEAYNPDLPPIEDETGGAQ